MLCCLFWEGRYGASAPVSVLECRTQRRYYLRRGLTAMVTLKDGIVAREPHCNEGDEASVPTLVGTPMDVFSSSVSQLTHSIRSIALVHLLCVSRRRMGAELWAA